MFNVTSTTLSFLLVFIFMIKARSSHAQLLPIVDDPLKTYIVHVHPPNTTGELVSDVERENWYISFLPNTTLDSGGARLVHSYHHVISGFAAKLTREEARAMEVMDRVMIVLPDQRSTLGTTYESEFLELNSGWNGIWKASDEGKGVIIGVVDSGIRTTHVSFQDDGTMPEPPKKWRGCCQTNGHECDGVPNTCNNKLIGARGIGPIKSPEDNVGHGTHVASIAAGTRVYNAEVLGQGKGVAVGIAPKAHLAMYSVCLLPKGQSEENFECDDSDILKGIEQAILDGVHVLSLSFDHPEPYHEDPIVKGTLAAVRKGIPVSACNGNGGLIKSHLANDIPWVLSVGASTMDRVMKATVKLGNGVELDGECAYQPSEFDSSSMLELVYPGETKIFFDMVCSSVPAAKVKGKMVICETGYITNIAKGENVKKAGAVAMLLLSREWDGFTYLAQPHVLPTVHLNFADSRKVLSYFESSDGPKTATFMYDGTQFGVRPAPAVASFSSRGPSLKNGGILKPDIIGPGVDILAAWHKQVGPNPTGSGDKAFTFAYGCSMATPALAGVIALLKSVHPEWSPAMIKSAIMTTAQTTSSQGQPILDEKPQVLGKASYFAMGAGHVNPKAAADPGLVYDNKPVEYIGYLCGLKIPDNEIAIIIKSVIFHCSNIQTIEPEQLNYPSISVSLDSATTKTIRRTVTNVGVANLEYEAEIEQPAGATLSVEPKTLKFSELNEQQSYNVTFEVSPEHPGSEEYSEGQLVWKSKGSEKQYAVRSPIVVKF